MALGPTNQRVRALARYVSSRSKGQTCLATREGPSTQRLRRLSFRRDRIVRRSNSLRWGTIEAKRRREFYYTRLGLRLRYPKRSFFRGRYRVHEYARLRRLKHYRKVHLDMGLRYGYRQVAPTLGILLAKAAVFRPIRRQLLSEMPPLERRQF